MQSFESFHVTQQYKVSSVMMCWKTLKLNCEQTESGKSTEELKKTLLLNFFHFEINVFSLDFSINLDFVTKRYILFSYNASFNIYFYTILVFPLFIRLLTARECSLL